MFGHRKTWTFEVQAKPNECLTAFANAFEKSRLRANAKWRTDRRGNTATATYLGRAGLHGLVAASHEASAREQAAARGSVVTFEAAPGADGTTTCRMWLSSHATRWVFFIPDAKFLWAYMSAVPKELKKLDGSVRVAR